MAAAVTQLEVALRDSFPINVFDCNTAPSSSSSSSFCSLFNSIPTDSARLLPFQNIVCAWRHPGTGEMQRRTTRIAPEKAMMSRGVLDTFNSWYGRQWYDSRTVLAPLQLQIVNILPEGHSGRLYNVSTRKEIVFRCGQAIQHALLKQLHLKHTLRGAVHTLEVPEARRCRR